jgi:hypothetical protein
VYSFFLVDQNIRPEGAIYIDVKRKHKRKIDPNNMNALNFILVIGRLFGCSGREPNFFCEGIVAGGVEVWPFQAYLQKFVVKTANTGFSSELFFRQLQSIFAGDIWCYEPFKRS